MPEAITQLKIFPLDGGQDSSKHPLLISPKDVVSSNNIVYSTYSLKNKRPGIYQKFRTPGGRPALAGVDFFRLGSQSTVVWNGDRLYAFRPNGVMDDITGAYRLPQNEVVSFTKYQGLLIICFGDGVTTPKAWTGSGAIFELDVNAPAGPFCQVWLNRIFIPDPSVPGRLSGSQTGSSAFVGGDSITIDLDPNDENPDGITAIFPPFFSKLYVAKRFGIWQISPVFLSDGSQVFSSNKITSGVGANSHNAVVAIDSEIYFTSDRGVHRLVSTTKVAGIETQFVSADIQNDWVKGVNFNRARYMSAVFDKNLNSYLIAYPSLSRLYPNSVWGYSIAADKWYPWNDYNHSCLFRYLEPLTKNSLTMAGSLTGNLGIIDEDKTTDYGKPFNPKFQSGLIAPGGSPEDQFSFQYVTVIFKPNVKGTFNLTYKIDGQTIETLVFDMEDTSLGARLGIDFILGESPLGGVPQVKFLKQRLQGNGMIWQFFIEQISTSEVDGEEGFQFLGLILDVDRLSQRIGPTVA